ncbi:MAG: hypothetical protein ACKPFF_37895 [Planktothrix sp.]
MTHIHYSQISPLKDIYLEDSYVLDIKDATTYELEVVLCESHPLYTPPLEGEQYCYKKCTLTFPNPTSSGLFLTHASPCVDPDGSLDYGNIDVLHFDDEINEYYLEGEWGSSRIVSDEPQLHYQD